ncbi:MAG: Rpn family recombination-promoting nuclease/putative transposase [Azospirillaceae bacterium]|nr:Rpn family recombination-promoting nuclease/putative transposase [Azospirillaceae bacterium]
MASPVSGNIHDAFFKQLMSEPATAGLFLRERLPPEVAALLSCEPPELLPGSFVDEELAQHHSDLLFRTRFAQGGEDALIFVLVEHKSAPEPLVALQVLRYLTRIWDGWIRQDRGRPLPVVIPLVVYHGLRTWTISPHFQALFGALPPEIAPYLPTFDYSLADLGRIDDEALSQQIRLRALLKALKYVLRPDLSERIDVVLAEVATLDLVDVLLVLTYIDKGPGMVDPETVRAALRRVAPAREEEIMGSITQPFFEEGVKQGLAQGEAKGKADALLRLLARRFGPVPDTARQQIAQADMSVLDDWFDAAVDAPDLDALFPRSSNH